MDSFVVDLTGTPTVAGAPVGGIYKTPPNFWHRDADVAGVGSQATLGIGGHEWRYVSTITDTPAQGLVVRRAAGAEDYTNTRLVDAAGIASLRVPGIWQWEATAGDFGWVLYRGQGAAQSDSNSTVDTPFMGDNTVAAGNVRDITATGEEFAIGLATLEDAGAAVLIDAWINCLG